VPGAVAEIFARTDLAFQTETPTENAVAVP
jgi:hypothetical protein